MTHLQKLKMARRMMTASERRENVPPFMSHAWRSRRAVMILRVARLRLIKTAPPVLPLLSLGKSDPLPNMQYGIDMRWWRRIWLAFLRWFAPDDARFKKL